ncbi:hypothetical protein KUCAC02_037632 [Chaenocephalus aceratus]|nr:hypothetical protein KUCAC02_037632 [Chaenocephalus aceratus]
MSAAGRLPEGLGSGAGRSLTNGDVVIGPWRLCDLMVTRSGPLGPVKPDVLLITSAAHINLHLSFLYEELNLDLLPSERTTLREQRLGAWLLDVLIEGPHSPLTLPAVSISIT